MAACTAVLGPTTMSATGLTETAVATWIVPAGTKVIFGVKANYASSTTQDVTCKIPIVRVYSQDLKIEPAQFMIEGEAGCIANSTGGRIRPQTYFPLNVPCKGGESIIVYGMLAVTTATAGSLTVTIYFGSETQGTNPFYTSQYHYKMYTTPTATVVTAGAKNTAAQVYSIAGAKKITAAYGYNWQTVTTATGQIGKFRLESPDYLVPFAIEFGNEGGSSMLLANNQDTHLTMVGHDPIDDPFFGVPVNSNQCNITGSWTAGPTCIVGAFLTGVQYI